MHFCQKRLPYWTTTRSPYTSTEHTTQQAMTHRNATLITDLQTTPYQPRAGEPVWNVLDLSSLEMGWWLSPCASVVVAQSTLTVEDNVVM